MNKKVSVALLAKLVMFVLVLTVASCDTKVVAGGTVVTKNNVPVEGANITFGYSIGGNFSGGSDQIQGSVSTRSGKDGKFAIDASTHHRNAIVEQISVSHDSGSVQLTSNFELGPDMVLKLR